MSHLAQTNFQQTIRVPKRMSAEALVWKCIRELYKVSLPLTLFDERIIKLVERDLPLVSGQDLNVHVHNFGYWWRIENGRTLQASIGADGNAAAQIIWITKTMPKGYFVSIAKDDERLYRHSGDDLSAPSFTRGDGSREFHLLDVRNGWRGFRSLVTFSPIAAL
jgi:hypothetical protein